MLMKKPHNSLKGVPLVRYLVGYLPEFKGKNYLLLKFAAALNKEWPTCIQYRSPKGLIYQLNLQLAGHRELLFLGRYEQDLTWVIENLLGDGDLVIEAGTDIGIHTVFMAKKVGPRGRIHGFDPLASAIADTQRHLDLNDLNNVILNQAALGEREGKSTIYSFANLPRAHSSLKDLGMSISLAQECSMTTIDNYVREQSINQLKLIKLDIEGYEMLALQGAMNSILQMHPLVVVEANFETSGTLGYRPQDIKVWFEELFYNCFVLRRGKWINIVNDEEIRHGDNMLFIWKSDTRSLAQLSYL